MIRARKGRRAVKFDPVVNSKAPRRSDSNFPHRCCLRQANTRGGRKIPPPKAPHPCLRHHPLNLLNPRRGGAALHGIGGTPISNQPIGSRYAFGFCPLSPLRPFQCCPHRAHVGSCPHRVTAAAFGGGAVASLALTDWQDQDATC
jgi:hypothetical protein